ncbi:MAG TPA: LPS export ABC transporter periplasmic protein LptC [Melioribacteraceae bacterium]|nr:LPS export ABC transporter periplasmic protein LptC [Melioribacteraceae bacterium]
MKVKIVIFLFLIFLLSCTDEKIKPKVENTASANIPIQESFNSKIYFSEDGKLKAILYADHLKMYENPKVTLIDGVKIEFFDKSEVKTTTLTSKYGKVDDITKNMIAYKNVVAVNDSGVTLTTEELLWRNSDRKITSDKFVKLISDTENIQGYGFESDQSLKNYTIYNITYSTVISGNNNE